MYVCVAVALGFAIDKSDYQSVQQKHKFWNSVDSVGHFRWEMATHCVQLHTQCSPGQLQQLLFFYVHRCLEDR